MTKESTCFYCGKTVVVTGATGLIGSRLVARLLTCDGIRLIAVGRSRARLEQVFAAAAGLTALELLEWDVAWPLPESLGPVDVIFHAAGPIAGRVIREEPVSVVSANLTGLMNCLDYLVAQKRVRAITGTLVVFSSATVYGVADEERVVDETQTQTAESLDSPTAAYSESKRMVEVVAQAYGRQYGVRILIARLGYVYGPCPLPPQTAFYEFLAKAARGEDLVFQRAGFPRRDNIFVDDAVEGLMTVCARGTTGLAYNVSSNGDGGNFAAIDELAEGLARAACAAGLGNVRVVVDACAPRAPGLALDNRRLKALGWTVRTTLEAGLQNVFQQMVLKGNEVGCAS